MPLLRTNVLLLQLVTVLSRVDENSMIEYVDI